MGGGADPELRQVSESVTGEVASGSDLRHACGPCIHASMRSDMHYTAINILCSPLHRVVSLRDAVHTSHCGRPTHPWETSYGGLTAAGKCVRHCCGGRVTRFPRLIGTHGPGPAVSTHRYPDTPSLKADDDMTLPFSTSVPRPHPPTPLARSIDICWSSLSPPHHYHSLTPSRSFRFRSSIA